MKPLPVFVATTTLVLIVVLTAPVVTNAHLDDSFLSASSMQIARSHQSATAGDHAIYVRESGTYPNDAVILPVLEALEARYAAANCEFTVEYWFKFRSGYTSNGKELFDHHIPSNEGFWTAFQDGQLWAGIDTEPEKDETAIHVQTGANLNDGKWHHYALVRDLDASPDRLCLYLDGVGTCYTDGSNSQWAHVYEDIRPSENQDGDANNNKPLYVIGSRTSGAGKIEAVIDELRISDVARYRSNFTPPGAPFGLDARTVMLFHFDEGAGNVTYGRDSNNNSIEGVLVKTFDNYGRNKTLLDPGIPADADWLSQMWVSGRFGSTTPSLRLISPNGGELWLAGSQHQIKWNVDEAIASVDLHYSTGSFTSISRTIVASTSNSGAYLWTTPITPSKTIRVRVASASNPAIYDDSDASFILASVIYPAYLPAILKNFR